MKSKTKTTIKYIGAKLSKLQSSLNKHSDAALWLLGFALLATGLCADSFAQLATAPGSGVAGGDDRIYEVVNRIFLLIEGNLGALIMISAGLGAIIAAAFGAYRAAVGLLVVAVGAFILRSLVAIFFDWQ
ncbi:MAG: hypothetical protein KDD66_17295 [Bdellovibrionales bacterium]|nr:hypothetical protein [Bdellovibrionales bacterium]